MKWCEHQTQRWTSTPRNPRWENQLPVTLLEHYDKNSFKKLPTVEIGKL